MTKTGTMSVVLFSRSLLTFGKNLFILFLFLELRLELEIFVVFFLFFIATALFFIVLQEIIQSHLNNTITYVTQTLKRSLDGANKIDYDLSTFIWTKQVADGVDRKGWLNSGNKPLSECGQLAMKANGFMPVIQK